MSPETLRNWSKRGNINYKCIQNKKKKTWLYDIESIGQYVKNNENVYILKNNKNYTSNGIIYVRVSYLKQSEDLERQKELLLSAFPNTNIISDIASGLNFHRPGFTKLLKGVCRNKYSRIIISFKDRIVRIGNEMFDLICKEHNCTIIVYGKSTSSDIHD